MSIGDNYEINLIISNLKLKIAVFSCFVFVDLWKSPNYIIAAK